MKSADVIKALKEDGWVLHHVKGSHNQFKHPEKDLPIGTLKNIEKQAQIKFT